MTPPESHRTWFARRRGNHSPTQIGARYRALPTERHVEALAPILAIVLRDQNFGWRVGIGWNAHAEPPARAALAFEVKAAVRAVIGGVARSCPFSSRLGTARECCSKLVANFFPTEEALK